MKQALVLVLVLVACGGGKSKDDGEIKAPILEEQKAKGSANEPVPAATEATPEPPAFEPVTANDLEPLGKTPDKKTQAAIAWKSASDGIDFAKNGKWADASMKFRDAVARVPEPHYFFNLCVTLYQEGKFGEALTSCNAVSSNAPPSALQTKADLMMTRIKLEAQRQGIDVRPERVNR